MCPEHRGRLTAGDGLSCDTALASRLVCKALHKSIVIREIVLLKKSGGKSGDYLRG